LDFGFHLFKLSCFLEFQSILCKPTHQKIFLKNVTETSHRSSSHLKDYFSGEKFMDRKLSDEQLDKIAKNLLRDFALDDAALDEIAESPRLWWNVKNQIEEEKARREKSWFAAFLPPILAFGALAILICFGLAVLFLSSAQNSNLPIAQKSPVQNPPEEIAKNPEDLPNSDSKNPETPKKMNPIPEKVSVKNAEPKPGFVAKNRRSENSAQQLNNQSKKEISPSIAAEETKTDFIALSYAANTDSGQIVRVKVPSSMMVSLGVKTNVEKESEMVNAEVVIGDDGLARAIRFVR